MDSNSPWLLIVNPAAGRGKTKHIIPDLKNSLNLSGINFSCFFSSNTGHIEKNMSGFIHKGFRNFIVAGGDGTMNECLNGIVSCIPENYEKITLAMFPIGTGNDLPRTHSIPTDVGDFVGMIKNGTRISHDIGSIRYYENGHMRERFFMNMAGFCFGARVIDIYSRYFKRLPVGRAAYFLSILFELIGLKNQNIYIKTDTDSFRENYFNIQAGVGKYAGGGMVFVPHAVHDDGMLGLTLIRGLGRMRVLRFLPRVYSGSFVEAPEVSLYSSGTISVESDKPINAEIDGELLPSSRKFEVSIMPGSIGIIVP